MDDFRNQNFHHSALKSNISLDERSEMYGFVHYSTAINVHINKSIQLLLKVVI